MGHFHGAVLHTVDHAEGRHQLASRVHRHVKLAARHLLDGTRKHVGGTINGVQGLGKARGNAPADHRLGMYCGGRCGRQNAGDTGIFQDGTTIQFMSPV
ncbi:hypothetical protein D3C86_1713300 [compost metagenome]